MKKKSLLIIMSIFVFYLTIPITKTVVASNIINPKTTYSYDQMVKDIKLLSNTYPSLIKYKVIGKSEYGRDIYAISLGKGAASVFINGAHHAREWITTNLNVYGIIKM